MLYLSLDAWTGAFTVYAWGGGGVSVAISDSRFPHLPVCDRVHSYICSGAYVM